MAKKIRIGIIFGGQSKEREISFAGGRTVYDNLNKFLFEAVPVFVDSFGNFIELKWEYIFGVFSSLHCSGGQLIYNQSKLRRPDSLFEVGVGRGKLAFHLKS